MKELFECLRPMTEEQEIQSKREDLEHSIGWSKWSIGFNEGYLENLKTKMREIQEEIITTETMIKKEQENLLKNEEELKKLG